MSKSRKISEENRDKYVQIGFNIAYYRKRLNYTQEDLAYEAGISRSYMSTIEAPKSVHTVSLEVLFDIAKALKVPVSKLLEFKN